jgi:hypothetical protein
MGGGKQAKLSALFCQYARHRIYLTGLNRQQAVYRLV